MLFNRDNNFAILTTKHLRNEPMAKILTSRLAPSFWQHNLHLVVLGRSLIVVMKFQDRFASLRQLNSPNGHDKFQICCINFYLIRFLVNSAVIRMFFVNLALLPEFRISTTSLHNYQKLWCCELRHLHYQAIWYYEMVRFCTIDLKLHWIAQFEENRIIRKKMLNSSKVNNKF